MITMADFMLFHSACSLNKKSHKSRSMYKETDNCYIFNALPFNLLGFRRLKTSEGAVWICTGTGDVAIIVIFMTG